MIDYNKVLGVTKDATLEDNHKAYRLLVIKWHPDRNKGPDAEQRMKEINEAYAALRIILSREYDISYDSEKNYSQPENRAYQSSSFRTNENTSTSETPSWYYGCAAAMIFMHIIRACAQ